MTLQAESIPEIPDESGVLMVSGEDFVLDENRTPLLQWIQESGRLLMVAPPLQMGFQEIPIRWSVQYADHLPEGGSDLAALLAGEVQYRLHGDFLTDRIRNMQFSRQTLAVGYYRPRISTGVLAITVLPIWSLRTVDKPKLSQDWIARLFELSGSSREAAGQVLKGPTLTPLHFSFLLHLASFRHETLEAALDSLDRSPVFKITREHGSRLCEDLFELGYIDQTSLTDSGREALRKSPYAIYLNSLKEGNP
jgi:hypothetical protein